MPIPKPRRGQTQEQFMATCMGAEAMQEYKQDQRVAICMGAWRDAHGDQGQKPKPKAAYGSCPMPEDGESQAHYMGRCVSGGDAHADCLATFQDYQQGKSMAEKSVEMKWMPTTLEVKGINEGQRSLSGVATTSNVDLVGDSVVSAGARYKEPPNIPLLLFHDHRQVVGSVTHVDKGANSIGFQAKIAKVDEPGKLREQTDYAWSLVRSGLLKGVSIGFSAVPGQTELIKDGSSVGYKYKEWVWHELSLVVVPANQDATITVIRSLDEQARGLHSAPPVVIRPAISKSVRDEEAEAYLAHLRTRKARLESIVADRVRKRLPDEGHRSDLLTVMRKIAEFA